MLAAALRTTAVIVAFLAAWLVVGSAAQAHPAPLRTAAVATTVQADASSVVKASSADVSPVEHHHHAHPNGAGDKHCPAGGTCCDAMCHAVVLLDTEQEMASVEARYASYATIPDVAVMSRSVDGLDRPPRPISI